MQAPRVAMVGAGYFARFQLEGWRDCGVKVVALCDTRQERAQALARQMTGERLQMHVAAHRRLTHPAEMGTVFKTCALYPDGAPTPPGLEP